MKQIVRVLCFLSIVAFAVCTALPVKAVDKPILYVKEGCAHCAKVEAFIEDHSLGDTLEIQDVVLDDDAAEAYTSFMEEAEVPSSQQGVPFLVYEDNKWLSGDAPIIEYLAKVNNIEIKDETEGGSLVLIIAGGAAVLGIVGYGIVNAIHDRKKQ